MTRKKKACLIVVVILVLGIAFLLARALIDAPPPDDADLLITYDDIPDEQNAFTYLEEAAEQLWWPEDHWEKCRAQDLLEDGAWDDDLAEQVLEQNEATLAFVERAAACPAWQVPENTAWPAEELLSYRMRQIARLRAIRAELLFRQGKQKEALKEAVALAQFGTRLQESRGRLPTFSAGTMVKEYGLRRARHMLPHVMLPPPDLAPHIGQLGRCYASTTGLADALKLKYGAWSEAADDPASFFRLFQTGLPFYFRLMSFRPNATKRLLAASIRGLIRDIPKAYSEVTLPAIRRYPEIIAFVKGIPSGNGKGLFFHYCMLSNGLLSVYKDKYLENCSVAATQILIALKCHKMEHGELPEALGELVPEYFEKVPLDDFDGKPMRYSKEKRVIYSIGRDLVDSGGHDKTTWACDEPTFKIEF